MDDVGALRAWFAAQGTCAQQGFADYFEVDLPGAVCAAAACRCSRCWFKEKGAATGRRRPSCSVPSGSLDPDL